MFRTLNKIVNTMSEQLGNSRSEMGTISNQMEVLKLKNVFATKKITKKLKRVNGASEGKK